MGMRAKRSGQKGWIDIVVSGDDDRAVLESGEWQMEAVIVHS
jgi:hypothetical protein